MTGERNIQELATEWCLKLVPRVQLETAFKGFGFYYGAALGEILAGDTQASRIGLEAARALLHQYNPMLGLIPLGADAEEAGPTGSVYSSIDSLQATPLLLWAANQTGDRAYDECAHTHTSRVLEIHCRFNGSVIQSSELNAVNGEIVRHFTHKGISDTSVWSRAQAWAMLYCAMGFARRPDQTGWLVRGMAAADWWLEHIPPEMVAFWDFNDPAIPDTEHDTAATAIACAALLKLSELSPVPEDRTRYRDAAERTAQALIMEYLTPVNPDDTRPEGMLTGGCFNKRRDSRPQDQVVNAELIFGSYFLFESLLVLSGIVSANEV